MKPKTRQLLQENNRLEQDLSPENDRILTDIVVYLRAAPISEYQQELVRRDVTHMMLDGQRRGEDMRQVIGADYKAFCDQVLAEIPRQSLRDRALQASGNLCLYLSILGGIWLVFQLLSNLLARSDLRLPITVGDIVASAAILATATLVVFWICRFSLEENDRREKILVALCLAACLILLTISFFLQTVLFEVHFVVALAGVAALFGLSKLLTAIAREEG